MNPSATQPPFIAIACGGTGGHLFPGIAVARQLRRHGCEVKLLISPKEVDQQAVKQLTDLQTFTLPAVGLQNRNYFAFGKSFFDSYLAAWKLFREQRPAAVLAMGGFTSAPPVLAARKFRAQAFLHDSNTIPGKANRFLARYVDEAFVGFSEAASRLKAKKISVTGTPVRPEFFDNHAAEVSSPADCRRLLGLDADLPTLLIVGGSQGARGLNQLIISALPLIAKNSWQVLHLTGTADFKKTEAAYAALPLRAVVKPFLAEMNLALGAATICVSRSGASSLAEIAAVRLPSALVPLPTSADNHQQTNAAAYVKTGAARLLPQSSAPETVAAVLTELMTDALLRVDMQTALARWHAPDAAEIIAQKILAAIGFPVATPLKHSSPTNLIRA